MPQTKSRQQLLIAKGKMMERLRWHLEGNIVAISFAVLIVAVVAFAAIFGLSGRSSNSNGFGPDWECTSHPLGGPTCVKKTKP